MDQADLKLCVANLRNSDKAAFRVIFNAFQQSIFNFLLYKVKDQALAEDLLQDTFLKLWENRKKLKEEESVKAYLYKIASNLYLNHLRHAAVVLKHHDEELAQKRNADQAHPQFVLEEQEFHSQLIHAIETLPDRIKEVFLMSRIEALTNKEISERLGLSIKTIESHMGKALKMLCKSLPRKFFLKRNRNDQVK